MFCSPKGPNPNKKELSPNDFRPRRNLLSHRGSDPVYMKTAFWFFPIVLSFLFLAAGCHKSQGPEQHINVVMRKYSIEPAIIHLKTGQPVSLDVTTADVQHGFDVPDLGIKEPVQPGHTTTITITPQAKGEYSVKCGVICGPHHDDMTGKLIVE
jgi:heme/copper-type cytochrome/quinol oxidase subunit 2